MVTHSFEELDGEEEPRTALAVTECGDHVVLRENVEETAPLAVGPERVVPAQPLERLHVLVAHVVGALDAVRELVLGAVAPVLEEQGARGPHEVSENHVATPNAQLGKRRAVEDERVDARPQVDLGIHVEEIGTALELEHDQVVVRPVRTEIPQTTLLVVGFTQGTEEHLAGTWWLALREVAVGAWE